MEGILTIIFMYAAYSVGSWLQWNLLIAGCFGLKKITIQFAFGVGMLVSGLVCLVAVCWRVVAGWGL